MQTRKLGSFCLLPSLLSGRMPENPSQRREYPADCNTCARYAPDPQKLMEAASYDQWIAAAVKLDSLEGRKAPEFQTLGLGLGANRIFGDPGFGTGGSPQQTNMAWALEAQSPSHFLNRATGRQSSSTQPQPLNTDTKDPELGDAWRLGDSTSRLGALNCFWMFAGGDAWKEDARSSLYDVRHIEDRLKGMEKA